MLNLETEVVRHITHGNFIDLRRNNIDTTLFKLSDLWPDPENERTKVQSLLGKIYDYYAEYKYVPSGTYLIEDFPWLEEDYYLEHPTLEAKDLAERLRKRYAKDIQRLHLLDLTNSDPDEFVQKYIEGSRKVYQVLQSNDFVVSGDNVFDIVEYQRGRVEELKNIGHSLGFEEVDKWTGGVRPGHLAILAALPKRMKTWFLVKAFVEQMLAGERPIFNSLELSKEELTGRVLCMLAGISYTRYYAGELMPQEWKSIENAAKRFSEMGGVIIQPPFGSRFVPAILLEAERHDATSIIVDQFSFLQWINPHLKENEGYKEIVYDIKNATITYDLPWYMAAQLNRQSVGDDEFPIAQHLGLTRALEEASDLIMGIKSNDALKEEHQIMLGVIESRHCESGPNARWTIEYDFYHSTDFNLTSF